MSEASESWGVPEVERELRRLLAQPDAAATPADTKPALERVRRQLEWEWQRRLIVERNENSDASELTAEERHAREASIFATALAELLPLGALLSECEARFGRPKEAALTSSLDPADAGLQALAAADLSGALRAWSGTGDVGSTIDAIRARREPFAQRLLQQAAAHFAQAATLVGDEQRAELRAELRADYLEPARRVGTEQQRERAKQVGAALDLLLAPGAALPPPVPQWTPPAVPPPLPRRVVARAAPATNSSRYIPLIVAFAGLGALLLALLLWALPGAGRRAAGAASPSAIAWSTPQSIAVAEKTRTPTATPTEQPSATARPTARPTATQPSPQIVSVEPAELFIGALPVELRLRGADLDRIRGAQLLPEGGQPIALELAEGDNGELVLRLAALPEPIAGAVPAALVIDGEVAETPPIVLRDFKQTRTVAGVRQDYAYTRRIASDGSGAYTTIHEAADATTATQAPLRNGEQVEVLRDDVAGWYGVRIRVANDPAQTGKAGWVERWLVDDAGAPDAPEPSFVVAPRVTPTVRPTTQPTVAPTPRPQPTARPTPRPTTPPLRSFAAEVIRSFPGSGSSGGRGSCIQGVVRARGGAGVGAAAVAVNNGNAEVGTLTNGAGEYLICGLGDSTWSVLLRYIPGDPPLAREAVGTVYVNGGADQVAVVNFSER